MDLAEWAKLSSSGFRSYPDNSAGGGGEGKEGNSSWRVQCNYAPAAAIPNHYRFRGIHFTASGHRLAVETRDGVTTVAPGTWTGEQHVTVRCQRCIPHPTDQNILGILASPEGDSGLQVELCDLRASKVVASTVVATSQKKRRWLMGTWSRDGQELCAIDGEEVIHSIALRMVNGTHSVCVQEPPVSSEGIYVVEADRCSDSLLIGRYDGYLEVLPLHKGSGSVANYCLKAHSQVITHVEPDRQGRVVATCSADQSIIAYDAYSLTPMCIAEDPEGPCNVMRTSHNGRFLAWNSKPAVPLSAVQTDDDRDKTDGNPIKIALSHNLETFRKTLSGDVIDCAWHPTQDVLAFVADTSPYSQYQSSSKNNALGLLTVNR